MTILLGHLGRVQWLGFIDSDSFRTGLVVVGLCGVAVAFLGLHFLDRRVRDVHGSTSRGVMGFEDVAPNPDPVEAEARRIAELEAIIESHDGPGYTVELANARTRIGRLEAALLEIAALMPGTHCGDIARRALEEEA